MGRVYQQLPIAITVEGANILTRSLIIFGQGAIRCHPFVLKEIEATREPDRAKAVRDFDAALFGHMRFAISNGVRALAMGLFTSAWVPVPDAVARETRRYYQKVTRFSSAFAFLSDVSMLVLGGGLKRREKLSARLGDVLSCLYLVSAALKRYECQGRQAADLPLLEWSVWDAMFKAQNAMEGVISNYPSRLAAWFLRRIIFPRGRDYAVPSDRLGHEVARLLIAPSAARDRLTAGAYVPKSETEPLGCLEAALEATIRAEAVEAKIRAAQKAGAIHGKGPEELAQAALAANVISAEEQSLLRRAAQLRDQVIRVDDFPQDLGLSEAIRQAVPQRAAA
jgi:acyl-CoA dehydrogenase